MPGIRQRLTRAATVVALAGLMPLGLGSAGCAPAPTTRHDGAARALEREPMNEPPNQRRLVRLGAAAPTYVPPYQPIELLSDFWDCRGRRRHAGLDLAGVGQMGGLGTPVVAMARSRVLEVGTPQLDSERFGRPLQGPSTAVRGGVVLPTSGSFAGYGRVWFFTEDYGTAHTGVLVVTEILDGPLAGHRIRYMHLAAVHPLVRAGAELAPGQEIGLMGGTAVLESPPHVHVDAIDPTGRRVDLAPFLGVPVRDRADVSNCR